jgi:vacuolar-type H+-ATPase subunit E/Vma4
MVWSQSSCYPLSTNHYPLFYRKEGEGLTTQEKLRLFQESSIKRAYEKRSTELIEYKEQLEQEFEEHKRLVSEAAQTEIKKESENIKRENSEKLAEQQQNIRKELAARNASDTERLLEEVKTQIERYKGTEDYLSQLAKKIKTVAEIAQPGDYVTIYIDASDSQLKTKLELVTKVTLSISDESFLGGVRAVINDNILIDESLITRLDEVKADFNYLAAAEALAGKAAIGGA